MAFVSINGKLLQADAAHVSASDRSFRYGDGVFETIAVSGGVPYQWDWHMARLARGMAALRIEAELGGLARELRSLLSANGVKEGTARIHVSRGVGSQGYLPDRRGMAASGAVIAMEATPAAEHSHEAVSLWLSSYEKPSAAILPVNIKHANGLNSILSRMEARDKSCFDALLLSSKGFVSETSSGNIFWETGGVLYTPALSNDCIEGATRARIIALSPVPVQQVTSKLQDLLVADAVIICNVAWRALPVGLLKPHGVEWQSESLADRINAMLINDIAEHSQLHKKNW